MLDPFKLDELRTNEVDTELRHQGSHVVSRRGFSCRCSKRPAVRTPPRHFQDYRMARDVRAVESCLRIWKCGGFLGTATLRMTYTYSHVNGSVVRSTPDSQ